MEEQIADMFAHFPPQKILVPVDLSEPSLAAVAAAKQLGSRWVSRLELVHVADDVPPGLVQGADAPRELRVLEAYRDSVRARLRALGKDYPALKVTLVDGYPKFELAELAGPETADWVVMGTRGREGLQHLLLGSVAEAVVRSARVPVLVVHRQHAADWPRRILVPVRAAAYADQALKYALLLADNLGAAVTTIHVEADAAAQRRASEALEKRLAVLVSSERRARLGRIVALGKTSETILRAVERERFDLVVLAAHRKPFWESLVLGTTAERVLRHSPVPVLAVPSIGVKQEAGETEPYAEAAIRVWK